jgi:enolase
MYNEKTNMYNYMGKTISKEQLMDVFEDFVKTYPVKSIEDPLFEEDFEGHAELTKRLNIQIVGDDTFVSNIKRLMKGVQMKAANCILLKVNQVGTLTEALETTEYAKRNKVSVLVSERSGQTEDTWLADLTLGINAGQIKNGAPARSERVAQFNQLLRLEEELGSAARYAGRNYRIPY